MQKRVDMLIDQQQQDLIDRRAAQLSVATQRENLGLAIKHEDVATIRKVGDSISLTDEQLRFVIAEIKKCRKDIVYFANTYFRIIGDGGLQTIKLYKKQEELLLAMAKEKRLIVLAARQCGKSTTYTIYFLWQAMFFPDKKIAIAAHQFATAEEILSRIKLAYEYIPKEIKPSVTAYSNKQVLFDNNSEIRAFATGGNSLAGFSCDIIALDEAALWPPSVAETFFTTTMPVLSSRKNSKAIMVSTPRGTVNNKFYDIWSQANSNEQFNNKEGWIPFRIDWWDVPGRDEEWKAQQIATMGIERFRQEFGCEFSSSGTALLIPDDNIAAFRRYLSKCPDPVEVNFCENETRPPVNAQIWEAYDPTHTYVAGGDVCEGTGNDASVIDIMDVTNIRKDENGKGGIKIVATISTTNSGVLEFAGSCANLLKQYNWPPFIVENNGVGSGFIEALLYTFNAPADRVFSERKADGTIRYGIHSSNAIKLEAALFARELVTTDEIGMEITDKLLVDEMGTFIRKATSTSITYAASGNAHDDHMMTWIWALYLLHHKHIERYFEVVEAFKTKQGKVLPSKLKSIGTIEKDEDILQSSLHKIIVAMLEGDASALDPSIVSDALMKNLPTPQDDGELYYGAAGRGGSFTNKPYFIASNSYSRFDNDTSQRDADAWEKEAADDDDWDGVSGLWDDRPPAGWRER